VKSAAFAVCTPLSIDEAIACLAAAGPSARILAGGQSLMPLLAARALDPRVVIDIGHVPGLDRIALTADGGELAIGAMTRQRTAERHPLVLSSAPLLALAIRHIAHITVRNQGTVGGSIANADPTAELPTAAVGLGATMVVVGALGERFIASADFFVAPLQTAMAPGELLVAIRVPVTDGHAGSAFEEFSRRPGDIALASAAVILRHDTDGRIDAAQIALGSIGPTPIRAAAAEAMLVGELPSAELFAAAVAAATTELQPSSDLHATATYRRHLAGVLLRRALVAATGRAGR
jgi:carbon-monoxide dehydrogenase medium subunit